MGERASGIKSPTVTSAARVGLDVIWISLSTDSARRWSRLGCINATGPCGVGATRGSWSDDVDDLANGIIGVSCRDDFEVLGEAWVTSSCIEPLEGWVNGVGTVACGIVGMDVVEYPGAKIVAEASSASSATVGCIEASDLEDCDLRPIPEEN